MIAGIANVGIVVEDLEAAVAFSVDDVDATVGAVRALGCELLGDVVQYLDAYRLCYVRGPEGIILMLAESLG